MTTAQILSAFATLFVIMDPVALTPMFIALTAGETAHARRAMALRACLVGAFVLTLFGLFGKELLHTIGISMAAFRISGGILLFLIALEMLFEKRTERRRQTAETDEAMNQEHDPSVFPIAVPMIAGPGAMASMVLLAGEGSGWRWLLALHAVMFSVILITFGLFLVGVAFGHLLGRSAINVISRLLGILLAALSVQIVLDGFASYGLVAN